MDWPDRIQALAEEKTAITRRFIEEFGHYGRLPMLQLFVQWLGIEWQQKINNGEIEQAKGIYAAIQSLKTIGEAAEEQVTNDRPRIYA